MAGRQTEKQSEEKLIWVTKEELRHFRGRGDRGQLMGKMEILENKG